MTASSVHVVPGADDWVVEEGGQQIRRTARKPRQRNSRAMKRSGRIPQHAK